MEINLDPGGGAFCSSSSVKKNGCCFLCLSVITIIDDSNIGAEAKSVVSLKPLQRYFRIGESTEKKKKDEVPLTGIINDTAVSSSSLALSAEENIEVDLCEPCTKIVSKFKAAFLSLEKAQMEINYWSGRIHHQISSEGSEKRNELSKRIARDKGDAETLDQLLFVDNLRKGIARKSLTMKAGSEAKIILRRSRSKENEKNSADLGNVVADVSNPFVEANSNSEGEVNDIENALPTTAVTEKETAPPQQTHYKTCVKNLETGGFTCTLCHKQLKSRHACRFHHEAIHLGKRFPCDLCKRHFTQKPSLVRHRRTCNGIWRRKHFTRHHAARTGKNCQLNTETKKPFKCGICNASEFSTLSNLIRHHQTTCSKATLGNPSCKEMRDPQFKFSCSICGKRFRYPSDLIVHSKKAHIIENAADNAANGGHTNIDNSVNKITSTVPTEPTTPQETGVTTDNGTINNFSAISSTTTTTMWIKNKKTGAFNCSMCDKELYSTRAAKMHYEVTHLGKRYPCPLCKWKFNHQTSLTRHMKTCNGLNGGRNTDTSNQSIDIDSEEPQFPSSGHSDFVKRDDDEDDDIEIILPSTRTTTTASATAFTHSEVRLNYFCWECNIHFTSSSALFTHNSKIHLKQKHKCEFCNISKFTARSSLLFHQRTCKATLQNRLAVQAARERDPNFKFVCPNINCRKRFRDRCHLEKHFKGVHMQERNLSCDICGKKYAYAYTLREHKLGAHFGRKFSCKWCQKKYQNRLKCKYHEQKCRDEKKKAERRIEPLLSNAKWFVKNIETGAYNCSVCDKQLKSTSTAKTHYESFHLGKRFPCDLCKINFSQRASLMRHRKTCDAAAASVSGVAGNILPHTQP